MNNHIVDEWVDVCNKNIRFSFFDKYPLDDRVLRLFGVACCREIWDQLTDERSRKAVEIAELYADGLVSKKELEKAHDYTWDAWREIGIAYTLSAYSVSSLFASVVAAYTALYSTLNVNQYKQQGIILFKMYPIPFNNNWITTTTKCLAQNIYDNKDFSLMPILADALQDVDCNEEVLEHLRSPGPFYKGNYIVDVLSGKRS